MLHMGARKEAKQEQKALSVVAKKFTRMGMIVSGYAEGGPTTLVAGVGNVPAWLVTWRSGHGYDVQAFGTDDWVGRGVPANEIIPLTYEYMKRHL